MKKKYTGVRKNGKKFSARVYNNGAETHLGVFDTPELAHKAYKEYYANQIRNIR